MALAVTRRFNPSQTIEIRMLRSALGPTEFGLSSALAHLVVIASGTAQIDGPKGQSEFEGARLAWLPPGVGGRMRLQAGTRGAHMKVSEVGLARAVPVGVMSTRLRELLQRNLILPLPDADRAAMLAHLETIGAESYVTDAGSDIIASSLVSVILVRIWRLAQAEAGRPRAVPRSIVDRFVVLVAQHRRDHWRVEDYARSIGVTRDRLGSAIARATGVSPQAFIHRELMNEARDLLLNSGLQVTEIAFRLGFQDPAYFNRLFSRLEGQPPGRFRRLASARDAPDQTSFAAWP